eukprot:Mrub_13688.p1 GENE.Mrub_13688~~Mrub_13688.p1  ORF type:complete len:144 (-),score=25.90 Mrub_13688:69-500(-)
MYLINDNESTYKTVKYGKNKYKIIDDLSQKYSSTKNNYNSNQVYNYSNKQHQHSRRNKSYESTRQKLNYTEYYNKQYEDQLNSINNKHDNDDMVLHDKEFTVTNLHKYEQPENEVDIEDLNTDVKTHNDLVNLIHQLKGDINN